MSSQGLVPQGVELESGPRDFFVYSAEFLPIGATATATVRVPIQADSAFALMEITGDVRALVTDEAVIAAPAMRMELRDEGTGRILMDRAQMWDNIIGTAQRPFFLPAPKVIRANSTFVVTLTNDNANARQVRIAFVGYKIFP